MLEQNEKEKNNLDYERLQKIKEKMKNKERKGRERDKNS